MTLMLRPANWMDYFKNKKGTILNISDPILIPRYLHFIIASIAMGGLGFSIISWKKGKQRELYLGLRWFIGATIIQAITGGLVLISSSI